MLGLSRRLVKNRLLTATPGPPILFSLHELQAVAFLILGKEGPLNFIFNIFCKQTYPFLVYFVHFVK